MAKPLLLICYHPTTVVLIDDKKSFLKELHLRLNRNLCYKLYTYPEEFIENFNEHYSFEPFTKNCIISDNNEYSHVSHDIDLRVIHKEIFNSKRFEQISTLITDYAMPSLNGLECCKAIDNPYINKILLTGQADNDLAVEAFNKKLINKFIQKTAPHSLQLINAAIQESQTNYFKSLSEEIYPFLSNQTQKCLSDLVFANFFHALCVEKNIIEYYLLDEQASFLLVDFYGKTSWLAVANEDQMNGYYEVAKYHSGTSNEVKSAIESRKKIPFFYSDNDLNTSPSDWGKYLHAADKLVGKENYYYAYIEQSDIYFLDKKLSSYSDYLQKYNK